MSDKTKIKWADHTGSAWYGCSKVSPGCANCYAEKWAKKMGIGWGDDAPRVQSKGFWTAVYRWDSKPWICDGCGTPQTQNENCEYCSLPDPQKGFRRPNFRRPRVFPSLCDWLDDKVPIEWLADYLTVIHDCQNLDFLLITKRPENWEPRLYRAVPRMLSSTTWAAQWRLGGEFPSNVHFGITVENQPMADKRIPILLSIPAKVRWLSCEPLLEKVNLERWLVSCHSCGNQGSTSFVREEAGNSLCRDACVKRGESPSIDWVVVGGESGPNRRDCGVDAILDVADQCRAAGVPCFVKQDCAHKPGQQGRIPDAYWAINQFPQTQP